MVLHHAECNPVPHYIVASCYVPVRVLHYLCNDTMMCYFLELWQFSSIYILMLSCNIISIFYDCSDQVSFIICNLRERVWNIYSFVICMIIWRTGLFLLHLGAVDLVPNMAELMKERWDCREEGCGWRANSLMDQIAKCINHQWREIFHHAPWVIVALVQVTRQPTITVGATIGPAVNDSK